MYHKTNIALCMLGEPYNTVALTYPGWRDRGHVAYERERNGAEKQERVLANYMNIDSIEQFIYSIEEIDVVGRAPELDGYAALAVPPDCVRPCSAEDLLECFGLADNKKNRQDANKALELWSFSEPTMHETNIDDPFCLVYPLGDYLLLANDLKLVFLLLQKDPGEIISRQIERSAENHHALLGRFEHSVCDEIQFGGEWPYWRLLFRDGGAVERAIESVMLSVNERYEEECAWFGEPIGRRDWGPEERRRRFEAEEILDAVFSCGRVRVRERNDGKLEVCYGFGDCYPAKMYERLFSLINEHNVIVCEECGNITFAHRSTRRTCSDACKQARSRRKREARKKAETDAAAKKAAVEAEAKKKERS